jgi:hypothetical protein
VDEATVCDADVVVVSFPMTVEVTISVDPFSRLRPRLRSSSATGWISACPAAGFRPPAQSRTPNCVLGISERGLLLSRHAALPVGVRAGARQCRCVRHGRRGDLSPSRLLQRDRVRDTGGWDRCPPRPRGDGDGSVAGVPNRQRRAHTGTMMTLLDARARRIVEYAKVRGGLPDLAAVRAMVLGELRAAAQEETARRTALIREAMSGLPDVPKESQRKRRG